MIIRAIRSAAQFYDSFVVIYDEVVSFDIGDFLYDWQDETIKIFDFRETIVDKFIEIFFTLIDDPEVKRLSIFFVIQEVKWSILLRSVHYMNSVKFGNFLLASIRSRFLQDH